VTFLTDGGFMHDTAFAIGRNFFEIYGLAAATIVELGACNVNGALRDVSPEGSSYLGLDIAPGRGVDVVIKANTTLPIVSEAADIVVSSSMFEHDAFFWQTFLEMARITKPGGHIYINAPSNGLYHRYPVDNWRFYPDCGKSLADWGACNGQNLTLIESFVAERMDDLWNDFVAIFRKNGPPFDCSEAKFVSDYVHCTNVWRLGKSITRFERETPEDMILIRKLQAEVKELRERLSESSEQSALIERLQGEIRQLRERSPTPATTQPQAPAD
jgi:SAM-dependent methyltransferase